MPTLRQLKALTLIAETGSFTRAAERLFITQSAVSALIRELEEEIGVAVIRRGRVIALTDAGLLLQRAARRADSEIEHAVAQARRGASGAQTVLRVAAGALSAAALMPPVIAELRRTDPDLRIVLFDRPVGMLGDMLLSGEADIALGSVDSPLRLSGELLSTLLLEDRISIVLPHDSPLAPQARRDGGLGWNDLRDTPLVLVGRTGGQWNLLLQDQLSANEGLSVGYEIQLLSTALELVKSNLGAALLPTFATRVLEPGAFCVAPLLRTGATWNLYLVRRAGESDEAKARASARLQQVLAGRVASTG